MTNDDELRKIVKMAVQETFLSLGLDIEEPLEVQKDFQHLRSWRESTDTVKRQGLVTAAGALVVAFLGLVWTAIHKGW